MDNQRQVISFVRTVWSSCESKKCVPVIGPDMPRGSKGCLTTTGINFRPMPIGSRKEA